MSIHNWKFSPINNKFFWEATNEEGGTLGRSSQDFKSKSGAFYNADLLGRSGKFSQQLIWEIYPQETGFKWKADNKNNKENVGMAHKIFESRQDAESNAALFGYIPKDMPTKASSTVIPPSKSKVSEPLKEKVVSPAATPVEDVKVVDSDVKEIKSDQYSNFYDTTTPKESSFLADWWTWLLGLILLLALFLFLVWPWLQAQNNEENNNVNNVSVTSSAITSNYTEALKEPKFSTLSGLIQSVDLGESLNKFGPLVLMAPTNDAIAKLPAETVAQLSKPENKTQLQELLKLHVIPGNIELGTLKSGASLKTLAGSTLPVEIVDEKYNIGGVNNVDKNLDGSSGNIKVYGIDEVLTTTINPPSISSQALESVVSSQSVNISSQASTQSSAKSVESVESPKPEVQNINVPFVQELEQRGNFTMFVKALKSADLKNSLEATAPITVFAPNDDALKSIQARYDELMKPENKAQLQNFVRNHIVNGTNSFEDFKINKKLTAQNGRSIIIKTNDQGVGQVIGEKNTALAPMVDIRISNAIMHFLSDSPLKLE